MIKNPLRISEMGEGLLSESNHVLKSSIEETNEIIANICEGKSLDEGDDFESSYQDFLEDVVPFLTLKTIKHFFGGDDAPAGEVLDDLVETLKTMIRDKGKIKSLITRTIKSGSGAGRKIKRSIESRQFEAYEGKSKKIIDDDIRSIKQNVDEIEDIISKGENSKLVRGTIVSNGKSISRRVDHIVKEMARMDRTESKEGLKMYYLSNSKEAMPIKKESLDALLKAVNLTSGLSYGVVDDIEIVKETHKIVKRMKLTLKSDGREAWLDN